MNNYISGFIRRHDLTNRESDVLTLLLFGVTSAKNISESLDITSNTAMAHLRKICSKTKTTSACGILALFIREMEEQRCADDSIVPNADAELPSVNYQGGFHFKYALHGQ